MFDVVIACIVIGIPSMLALIVIDLVATKAPTYRSREQEQGAAGIFHDYRAPQRHVASLGVPELDTSIRPSGATVGSGDVPPTVPRPVAEIAPPLATLHP
jgi:hypothetical protein